MTYEKIQNDSTKMETLKSDISALIAHNWFASESLANPGDKSGANPGDSYLATITTALENSLSTPNSQKTLWVGGMGSGVRNKTNDKTTNPYSQYPADPSHQDGFYWVTGPEGLVTNEDGTTGTKFWDTSKSSWNKDLKKSNYGEQVYGYTKWSSWSGGGQPDNSSPFLTVGYGNNNAWDDAAIDGGTTVGFVQETNLYNSSLNIKTDGGKVTLQGDLGKSVGLDTVKIDAGSGSVTTGNTTNTATEYNHGTIYADHGVYINGGEVTVGGEIHSGGTDVEATRNTDDSFNKYLDNVTINSSGNLTVHGIEVNTSTDSKGNTTSRTDREGGKIKLTSTGTEGVITLGDGVDYNGKNTNGGVLKAASTAQGAVVIDAQGSKGSLVNSTTGTSAITTGKDVTTGKDGTWQVYVASPSDYGTFLGDNLNSEINAQWSSESTKKSTSAESDKNAAGRDIGTYTDHTHNKFIFQMTPVITISGGYTSKTYGDTLSKEKMAETLTSKAAYKDSKGSDIDVTDFKNNFDESNYLDYVISSDSTKKGLSTVNVSSDGAANTATRTSGNEKVKDADGKETNEYKKATDGNKAFYVMDVAYQDGVKTLNGYDKAVNDGEVEITKRSVSITSSGEQTYGDSTYTSWTDTKSGFANGDDKNFTYKYGIKSGSDYETNLNKTNGRTTADFGEYTDSVSYSNPTISGKKNADGTDDTDFFNENYTFDTANSKGSIKVNKAPLHIYTEDVVTPYGIVRKTQSRATGLTNGDEGKNAGFSYDYGDYGHGYLNGNTMTNQPGSYPITTKVSGLADDLMKNYDITIGEATLHITPLKPDQTTHYVEGAHRPQDKLESALPVFRVDASGVVKQYGTYGIESQSQAVTLSPTGMRMPEPNQTSTQDRKYLTTLKTAHGHGTFRLEYNGVVLRVIPVDPAAEQIVEAGDKLKNVALSEQALHAAYTQMGLDLVNLKGVYIYMAPM